jgi:predicted nucleic acid-binding protein
VRIVLDANLIAALALQMPYAPAVEMKMLEWNRLGARFAAPALWSYEVGSALRKAVVTRFVPGKDLDGLIALVWALDIESIPDSPDLQRRALAWAERLRQSKSYDGAYLAVAEALGAEFWTADRALVDRAGVDWVRLLEAGPGVGKAQSHPT